MTLLGTKRFKTLFIVAVVIAVGLGVRQVVVARSMDKTGIPRNMPLFETRQGPLSISVNVAGTIKAREKLILRNEVEGMTTILSIIPEGTVVKAGDLLIELDSSSLVEERVNQEIAAKNAEADFIGAREDLEVIKNQAQSDLDDAIMFYQFAQEDLKNYIEGNYPMLLKEAETDITLAEGTAKQAENLLEGSRRLAEKEFITATDLEQVELSARDSKLRLELRQDAKRLLEKYTYTRQITTLESDVKRTSMALERAERKAKADVIQAEARLEAITSQFEQEQARLAKAISQLEKMQIIAPMDGLVVYATTSRAGGFRGSSQEPLEEGRSVREREELIHLPTTASFRAEVQVHETDRSKVFPGLPVRLTIDALPGKTYYGIVNSVAPLPNAQTSWMNPDLKVYDTDIFINDDVVDGLLTGMSCLAEIVIQSYEDVTYVPVQAVVLVENEHFVYIVSNGEIEQRKVEIGLDNNRMIHVKSGLEAGEKVRLEPPLAPSERGVSGSTAADSKFKEFAEQTNRDRANGIDAAGAGAAGHGAGDAGGPGARQDGSGGGFLDRLPEDVRKKVEGMSREERRAYFQEQGMSFGGGGRQGGGAGGGGR